VNLDELPELLIPNSLAGEWRPDYLSRIKCLEEQLSQIQQENGHLKAELAQEREQSTKLSEQNTILNQQKSHETKQREQIQQELTVAKQIINQLNQKLINEQEKRTIAENNLLGEKQINHNLRQQLQAERQINTNLTQKLHAYEQNLINLQNIYQNAIKVKEKSEKQLNNLTGEIKSLAKALHQWQKLNHYKQLEKAQKEFKAQIVQPPPWVKT
jgi:chromosome segregation ATPase